MAYLTPLLRFHGTGTNHSKQGRQNLNFWFGNNKIVTPLLYFLGGLNLVICFITSQTTCVIGSTDVFCVTPHPGSEEAGVIDNTTPRVWRSWSYWSFAIITWARLWTWHCLNICPCFGCSVWATTTWRGCLRTHWEIGWRLLPGCSCGSPVTRGHAIAKCCHSWACCGNRPPGSKTTHPLPAPEAIKGGRLQSRQVLSQSKIL